MGDGQWMERVGSLKKTSVEDIKKLCAKYNCTLRLTKLRPKLVVKFPPPRGSLAYLHRHRNPSGTTDYGNCNLVSPIRHHRQSSQSTSFLRFKWDESEKDLARWNTRALAAVSMPKDTMPGMYSSQSLCILSPSAIHKWPIVYDLNTSNCILCNSTSRSFLVWEQCTTNMRKSIRNWFLFRHGKDFPIFSGHGTQLAFSKGSCKIKATNRSFPLEVEIIFWIQLVVPLQGAGQALCQCETVKHHTSSFRFLRQSLLIVCTHHMPSGGSLCYCIHTQALSRGCPTACSPQAPISTSCLQLVWQLTCYEMRLAMVSWDMGHLL